MHFAMRRPPPGADEPQDAALHALARACEGHAAAWRGAVSAYRSEMSNLLQMSLQRVRAAGERPAAGEQAAVEAAQAAIDAAGREVEKLRRAMVLLPPPLHLATEARQHFARMEKARRVPAVATAMKGGDVVTVAALVGAPAYLSGLSPDEQAQLRSMLPPLLFADQHERIKALEHAQGEVGRSAHELMRLVGELLPSTLVKAASDDEQAHRRAAELCEQEEVRRRSGRLALSLPRRRGRSSAPDAYAPTEASPAVATAAAGGEETSTG